MDKKGAKALGFRFFFPPGSLGFSRPDSDARAILRALIRRLEGGRWTGQKSSFHTTIVAAEGNILSFRSHKEHTPSPRPDLVPQFIVHSLPSSASFRYHEDNRRLSTEHPICRDTV